MANRAIENYGYDFSKLVWWSIKITCNCGWHISCNGYTPPYAVCTTGAFALDKTFSELNMTVAKRSDSSRLIDWCTRCMAAAIAVGHYFLSKPEGNGLQRHKFIPGAQKPRDSSKLDKWEVSWPILSHWFPWTVDNNTPYWTHIDMRIVTRWSSRFCIYFHSSDVASNSTHNQVSLLFWKKKNLNVCVRAQWKLALVRALCSHSYNDRW